ncbi:MAG TPA: hypothetical protein VIH90_03800 [Candidatus Saccharimonadales bacterium]
MANERAPVPVDLAQWPEVRGFRRIYVKDPERQARFVMALIGFKQELKYKAHDEDTVKAVDMVLRAFHEHYPEFMEDGMETDSDVGTGIYHMDDRLGNYMSGVLEEPGGD